MADKKISQLTDGTSLQSGDFVVIARSGDNFKVDPTQFGSSIDVTGTVTSDGLTVDGDGTLQTSDGALLSVRSTNNNVTTGDIIGEVRFESDDTSVSEAIRNSIVSESLGTGGNTDLHFKSAENNSLLNRATVSFNGDISFYEDTGTTPKFVWDASAESLGIGTSSPSSDLHIYENANTDTTLKIQNPYSGGGSAYASTQLITNAGTAILGLNSSSRSFLAGTQGFYISSPAQMVFAPNATEAMRIDSSGNVGIGNTSPDIALAIGGNLTNPDGTLGIGFFNDTSGVTESGMFPIRGGFRTFVGNGLKSSSTTSSAFEITKERYSGIVIENSPTNSAVRNIRFLIAQSAQTVGNDTSSPDEVMRIDSSGNVGIGTSSPTAPLTVIGDAVAGIAGNSSISVTSNTDTNNGADAAPSIGFKAPYATGNAVRVLYGQISAEKENTTSGNTRGALVFSTSPVSSTGVVERLRIDSSGNVGIGTDSPTTRLNIANTVGISGSGNDTYGQIDLVNTETGTSGEEIGPFITFRGRRGATDTEIAAYGAIGAVNTGVSGDSEGAIVFRVKNATGSAQNLVEQMRITTGGNVGIGTTSPGAKLEVNGDIIADGVYLGGTGAANLLDDYEEGTWTPTTAGDATGAFSSQEGLYRKVGNVVHLFGQVAVSTNFTGNSIGGLPFNVANLFTLSVYGGAGAVLCSVNNIAVAPQESSATIRFLSDFNADSNHTPSTTGATYRFYLAYMTS